MIRKNITKDIYYVGVNDHQVDLFEGQYVVPLGMAYNSYVIIDDLVVVMDTVDQHFTDEWLANINDSKITLDIKHKLKDKENKEEQQ